MNKLLIVIDAQNDFITGALRNEEAIKALPALVAKIKAHRGDVIATHDTHFTPIQVSAKWPPENGAAYFDTLEGKLLPVEHCIKLSEGWDLAPEVTDACAAKNDEPPKNFFSIDKYTFGWDGWKEYLKQFKFDEIELVGFCTDICVVSNALILRALFPNMNITVDSACCAGVTPAKHEAALEVMRSCQITVI